MQKAEAMRKTAILLFLVMFGVTSLLFMASCEDKSGQESPREYDPQIDSIASAPLPVIHPDMVEEASAGRAEPGTGIRERRAIDPDGGVEPDMAPGTESVPIEAADNRSPSGFPADPNTS